MKWQRALLAAGALAGPLLGGCAPCDGARVRIAGDDGAALLEVCAEVATSEQERRAGLAGRAGLDEGAGLWMEFPIEGEVCVTGAGMRFPIDVVMVGASLAVARVGALGIQDEGALCAPGIQYVLEVGAGEAAGVSAGDEVEVERAAGL